MASLTPFDVSNLNRSFEGLGESFAQNRAEADRRRSMMAEELMRQRMLEESQKRTTLAEGQMKADQTRLTQGDQEKANLLKERAKEFAHKSWDSNVKFFSDAVKDGIMDPDQANQGLQMAISKMPPDAQEMLSDNASFAAVQSGKVPWKAPATKSLERTREVQNDVAATALEDQASELEQRSRADAGGPPSQKYALQQQAKRLRERAKYIRSPREDKAPYDTETLEYPPPADQPEAPTRRITRKVAPGTTVPGQTPPILPLPTKKEELVKGKTYRTARGNAVWDGTKFTPVNQ